MVGIGLPYSLFAWLLDPVQRSWTLICRFRRTPSSGGVGLLGMRERVAYYRGHIEFRSRPQVGMRIILTIPIDDSTAAENGEGGRMTLVG